MNGDVSDAPSNADPVRPRRRRWPGRLLRWTRTITLLVILVVVISGLFLNKVGLPGFAKDRLVAGLRAKGWEVDFSRARLRWYRGIVVENLHLQRTNQFAGPQVFVDEAQCRLNHDAFKRLELKVDSVHLAGGRLVLPVQTSNQLRRPLIFEDVGGELHFKTNDRWELVSLQARLLGVALQLSGTVTNASAIRDWKLPRRKKPPSGRRDVWEQTLSTLQRLKFSGTPELRGHLVGDALDLRSFKMGLKLSAPGIDSPWGAATNFSLNARLMPPADSNNLVQAELKLSAADARGSWGEARFLDLNMEVAPSYNRFISSNASLVVEIKEAQTHWGHAGHLVATAKFNPCPTNAALMQTDCKAHIEQLQSDALTAAQVRLTGSASHPPTNLLPAFLTCELELDEAQTPRGNAQHAQVSVSGTLPPIAQFHLFDTNRLWPARLENVVFDAAARLTNIQSAEIQIETSALAIDWQSPELRLRATNLLYRGELVANAELDATSRRVRFDGHSSIDVHKLSPLLSPQAQSWLDNYAWRTPPKLEAQGTLLLPAWTNRQVHWEAELMPTLSVTGKFQVGEGSYRTVPFSAAESPFLFSNMVWRLPNVKVTRPEGTLEGEYVSRPQTKEFFWRVRSHIDPKAIKPLFEDEEVRRRGFDYVEFTTPPFLEAEIRGQWRNLERLSVEGYVAATNFSFRGERAQEARSRVVYTNKVLTLIEPEIRRENERGSAAGIAIDIREQKVYFTNAFGNLNPHAVARTIGTNAVRNLQPYQFDSPPLVRVHGVVDIKRRRYEDDLHFDVSGGPFRWKQFRLQQLAGSVAWQARVIQLLNLHGVLHGGEVAGNARFDINNPKEPTFSFNATATNVDFRVLMQHLSNRTNKLEGMLSGELIVARAHANDLKSWQGSGSVHLRDGLLWDIPVLGLFSEILNTILPGLGNSRAKEATGDFIITNSVIDSRNLEIHATAMRMQYEGTVDFDRRLHAQVEAELLRDIPAIGFVVSKLLWPVTKLFEYRITGTLDQPKAEPVYVIPKLLLFPFQPFKTLKELFAEEPKASPEK